MNSPAAPKQPDSSSAVFSGALRVLGTSNGRAVITASRADQFSQESPAIQHGYFTACLLDSLQAGGAQWPLAKVFQDVRERVTKAVRNQTPSSQFSGSAESFVLGVPESSSVATQAAR